MYNYTEIINELSYFLKNYKINITEDDIFNLLKITNRWPYQYHHGCPSVEIICEWMSNYRDEFYDLSGKFNFERWKKKYDDGFTTILSDVLDLNEELRFLQNKLSEISGKSTQANFYFSKGTDKHRVSFNHHNHDYDVFVKIIYGKCKFKLDQEYFDCKSGDVIYIPSGTYHSVVECTDKKLSLTINLQ